MGDSIENSSTEAKSAMTEAPAAPGDESLLESLYHMIGLCSLMTLVSYLPPRASSIGGDAKPPNELSEELFRAAVDATQEKFWTEVDDADGINSKQLAAIFFGEDRAALLSYIQENRLDQEGVPLNWLGTRWQQIKRFFCGAQQKKAEVGSMAITQFVGHMRMLKLFAQHEGETGRLVYYHVQDEKLDQVAGITVNDTLNRVTVAFRGSQNLLDWITNFKTWVVPITVGNADLGVEPRKVGFHAGFYERMRMENNDASFFDVIKEALKSRFEGEKGRFTLYTTGHSLGGALATLMGFMCSLDSEIREIFEGPIHTVSLAAPRVGDGAFRATFQELEETGHLRHIRVMNPDDVVPFVPPSSFGFRHVGLRVVLYPTAPTVRRGVEMPPPQRCCEDDSTGVWSKAFSNHYAWIYTGRLENAINEQEFDVSSALALTMEKAYSQAYGMPRFASVGPIIEVAQVSETKQPDGESAELNV